MIIQQPQINTTFYATNPTDQSVTNNTTPQNSPLSVAVQPNSTYFVLINAPFNLGGIAPGYKFMLSGPTSTGVCLSPRVISSLNQINYSALQTGLGNAMGVTLATASNHLFEMRGCFTAIEAGNLTFQFAQNVSDNAAITLKAGALMSVSKIS